MVEALTPEALRSLSIRSGEHLAALLTTMFLITPPKQLDTSGGVDLTFDLRETAIPGSKRASILPTGAASAAFEIKSMPGPFREYDSGLNRDQARGIDTIGRALSVKVKGVNDILREAGPLLSRAQEQLLRKVDAGTLRNIFLVMHPFDHFPAECLQPVIGPYLEPLTGADDVDTVWVLWPMEHLTVWSNEGQEWIDLIFTAVDPDEEPGPPESGTLQDAEQYFFELIGYEGGSPYLFGISSE